MRRGHRHEKLELHHSKSAQTFRRKRALEFLKVLLLKELLLKKQLETPELQAANAIIAGELKATQSLMEDFVELFQLHEIKEELLSSEEQK